jgi:hypothetical protein
MGGERVTYETRFLVENTYLEDTYALMRPSLSISLVSLLSV